MNCRVAGSEAQAATTQVYSMAPWRVSMSMTWATVDFF